MDEKRKTAYVSYSRRSDYSFIGQLIVAAGQSVELQTLVIDSDGSQRRASPTEQGPNTYDLDQWEVLYDEAALQPGGSIRAFMETLSEGDKIIVLLSSGYFQSPFCLTELLQIYHKRASELLPLVVFVDGIKPADVKVGDLQEYWRNQQGSEPAKQLHARFIHDLPCALAWLLGIYDEAVESWDELFHVVSGADKETARQVIATLDTSDKPRFRHFSSKRRAALIAEGMGKIFGSKEQQEHFKQLREWSVSTTDGGRVKPFATAETRLCKDGGALPLCLDALTEWLEWVSKEITPSPRRDRLAGAAKELLGWVLLAAVDDAKLHILIHALNRQREAAALPLMGENATEFQMIVSAVGHSAVRFDLCKEKGLKGNGELLVNEQGLDIDNHIESVDRSQRWLDLSGTLFSQMSGRESRHKTQESLDDAIATILRKRTDFYLLFDGAELEVGKSRPCRSQLGWKYPEIQQVVSDGSNAMKAQHYYRDGLKSGAIDQQIHEIYDLIYEITHEPKDND